MITEIHSRSWLSRRSPRSVREFGQINNLEDPSKSSSGGGISKFRPWFSCIGDLEDSSNILVVSVIPKASPRSWLYRWSRNPVQDFGQTSNLEDPFSTLFTSVISKTGKKLWLRSLISKVHPRVWSNQPSRRSVKILGWLSDLEYPCKILVRSVISMTRLTSWSHQWYRRSVWDFDQISDLHHPSKISVRSIGSLISSWSWSDHVRIIDLKDRQRSWSIQWSRCSVQHLGWVSHLDGPSKVRMRSVIWNICSDICRIKGLEKSLQNLGQIGDLQNASWER